jgi:hypothetical protein
MEPGSERMADIYENFCQGTHTDPIDRPKPAIFLLAAFGIGFSRANIPQWFLIARICPSDNPDSCAGGIAFFHLKLAVSWGKRVTRIPSSKAHQRNCAQMPQTRHAHVPELTRKMRAFGKRAVQYLNVSLAKLGPLPLHLKIILCRPRPVSR